MSGPRRPFNWGPARSGDRTRFRLWAPGAAVALELEDGAVPMATRPEGWHEARLDVPAGTPYRFQVDGRAVPDPASRRQRGDVHGWSVVTDEAAYAWRHPDWRGRPWTEAVIYELHAGLLGGFVGVIDRLDELAELGITALELMPVADFPGARNWGYDGVLPYAPDEAYGTPDDLKRLVDAAHGRGLMVLLDVVYNHFGPDGNYLPAFAPAFFRNDVKTPWGDAIDFGQAPVRRFFIENALYWLHEFRFDGLRLDAVHAIPDRSFLRELVRELRTSLPKDRHIHLVFENENNDVALLAHATAQWNDDIHHAFHVLLTNEVAGYYADFASETAGKLARGLRDGFIYQGEYSVHRNATRGSVSTALPYSSFVAFLQNHDQIGNRALGDRLLSLAPPKAVSAATALLLLCPQIPLIFMGEEVGSRNPFLYFTDHRDPDLARAVREGRRAEFQSFPQFADPDRQAAIPDPNDAATFERSRPEAGADAAAWRTLYRALLGLRHRLIVPHLPGTRAATADTRGSRAIVLSWKLGNGALLTIATNLGDHPAGAPLPAEAPIWGETLRGTIPAFSTTAWLEPT